jgi:hypothetical protein
LICLVTGVDKARLLKPTGVRTFARFGDDIITWPSTA